MFSLIAVVAAAALVSQSQNPPEKVSGTGFRTNMAVPVEAKPAVVCDSLINHVGKWWHKSHTFSDDGIRQR